MYQVNINDQPHTLYDSEAVVFSFEETTVITLMWTEQRNYTITFDSDGGTPIDAISIPSYGTYSLKGIRPEREGYQFYGWYYATRQVYSGYYTFETDLTLKAAWNKLTPSDDFYYTTINDEAHINKYVGTNPIITVPDTIDGYQVVQISDQFLADFKTDEMVEIHLPKHLRTVKEYALSHQDLKIVRFTVHPENPHLAVKDDVLYNKALTEIISYPSHKPGESYTFIESITSIYGRAFSNNAYLTHLTIPNTVTTIKRNAFQQTLALKTIDLPNKLETINANVFYRTSLESITIPASVTSIKEEAFYAANNLRTIIFESGTTLEIGLRAFAFGVFEEFKFPNSVINISPLAFYGSNVKQFIIEEDNPNYQAIDGIIYTKDLKTIVAYPEMKAGESFTMPSSVDHIGAYAFYNVLNLKEITIPSTILSMGKGAFQETNQLKTIHFEENARLETLPEDFIRGNNVLTEFIIPPSVTSIETNAFRNASINAIFIPKTVLNIATDAFYQWSEKTIYVESETDLSGYEENWHGGASVTYGATP